MFFRAPNFSGEGRVAEEKEMGKKRRATVMVATLLVLAALLGGGVLCWPCQAWGQIGGGGGKGPAADKPTGKVSGPGAATEPAKPTKRIGVFVGGNNPGLGDTLAELIIAKVSQFEAESVGPELLKGRLKMTPKQVDACLASTTCLQGVVTDHKLYGVVMGRLLESASDCVLKLGYYVPGQGAIDLLPLSGENCQALTGQVAEKMATLLKEKFPREVLPPAAPPPAEATKASFEDAFGQCKHKAKLAGQKPPQVPLAAALETCEQALGLLASAKDDGARAKALFFVAKNVYYVLGTTENPASRVGHMNLAVLTAKRAHELSVAANDIEFTGEVDRFTDAIVKGYSPYDLRPGLGWAELRPEFRVIDMQIIRAPIAVEKKQALGLLQTQFKRGVELPVTVWIPFGKPAVRDALGQTTLDAQIVISLNGVAFEVVSPSDRKDAGMLMVPALANVEDFLKPPRLMAVTVSAFGSPGVVGGYAGFGLGLMPGLTLRFEVGGASVSSTAEALKPLSGEVGLSALLEWCPAGTAWSADFGLCFGGGAGGAWLLADEADGMAGTVKLSAGLKLPAGFTVELGGRGTFGGMGYVYPALGVRWQYLFGGTPPASQEEDKSPPVAEKAAGEGKEKAGGEVEGAAKEVAP